MKKYKYIIVLLCLIGLFCTTIAFASEANNSQHNVFDHAKLFSEKQEEDLESLCKKYGNENKINIILITKNRLDGKTREKFLEDFYDKNNLGDCVILLVNTEANNRGVEIQGYGKAKNKINNNRIENILDEITPMLKEKNYYNACETFVYQVIKYMHKDNKQIFFLLLICIPISLIIGGCFVWAMAYRSGGVITVNSRTYLDNNQSKVLTNKDTYVRTVTTKIEKPHNNISNNGEKTTNAGHSHSGGGRNF